jgi:hypothetical protein
MDRRPCVRDWDREDSPRTENALLSAVLTPGAVIWL